MLGVELSANAITQERTMTPVLYEKFSYIGGRPEKAKKLVQPRQAPQIQTAFVDMYSMIMIDKTNDPNEVFTRLSSVLDVSNLHPKILAVSQFLVITHNITDVTKLDSIQLKEWLTDSNIIWSKLLKGLPKEPTPSIDAQIVDIFRYIVMIVNYTKR